MYKRSFHTASFILLLSLLSMMTMPVMAQQVSRLGFLSIAKGSGCLCWGVEYGTFEYAMAIDDGTLIFTVSACAEETEIPDKELVCILKEGTVKAGGLLSVKWFHEGNSHELHVILRSTKETEGVYVEEIGPWGTPGEPPIWTLMRTLGIWADLDLSSKPELFFDPAYATLSIRGIYKFNNERQKISGTAGVTLFDFPEINERTVTLGLWIKELGTYVALLWWSEEAQFQLPGETEPIIVPPAAILKIKIKLI